MSVNGEKRGLTLEGIIESGRGQIHMSGILGISMSSLAKMLSELGICVSGSDDDLDAPRDELSEIGIGINNAMRYSYIGSADALVYSSAISPSHRDRSYAAELGIPQYSRAELLGALMLKYRHRIGVSGTHGKSTTTAMLASIFLAAGLRPTVLCGARMGESGAYIRGGPDHFIYEACEYRDSFLHFSPTCAIITNIELDHTDYFKSETALADSFLRSVSNAELVVASADYPMSAEVARDIGDKAVTVGRSAFADYRYESTGLSHNKQGLILYCKDGTPLEVELGALGEYNVANAAIAAVTAMLHGVPPDRIISGLSAFSGVEKRLELIGTLGGRDVYRDYAHHPTEIRAVINALRRLYGSVAVLFRPHTYTRTRDFWREFVRELSLADEVGIYEIYPAREDPIDGISAERLALCLGGTALTERSAAGFVERASSAAVVLMGAGDLRMLETEISRCIKENGK